jgi:hypothetical protein
MTTAASRMEREMRIMLGEWTSMKTAHSQNYVATARKLAQTILDKLAKGEWPPHEIDDMPLYWRLHLVKSMCEFVLTN